MPAVDRAARAQDVDAGGEALLDDRTADALGFFVIGEDAVNRDDAHAGFRPRTCAPQTVEATTKAPTAW